MFDLELDLSQSIEFYSLRADLEQILADEEIKFTVKIKIKKNFTIADNLTGGVFNVDKVFLISPLDCDLYLNVGMNSLNLKLYSEQEYLQCNQYGYFVKKFSPLDIKILSQWKEDKTIQGRFIITGHGLIKDNTDNLRIVKISSKTGITFNIDNNTFDNNIFEPAGLTKKYIQEFELETPIFLDNKKLDQDIIEFISKLLILQNELKTAILEYRKSQNITSALIKIRTSLDLIKNFNLLPKDFTDRLAQLIYVNTKIFQDLPNHKDGSLGASKDIVTSLQDLFSFIFNFNSKAVHFKEKGSNAFFKMNPDIIDFEFILNLALVTTNYLINRINNGLRIVKSNER